MADQNPQTTTGQEIPTSIPTATPQPQPPTLSPELAGIAVSMRIPAFWRDRPRLWFICFEAATHDMQKGQKELAQMVIKHMEKQDVEQICDLLFNPPATKQYDALKARLISVYEESEGRQFQKLLSDMELGDQKPTQLLRRMRDLAREKVPDSTLRLMWINHLPVHVRSILVVTKETSLDELALLADKMTEQVNEVATVSALTRTPQDSSPQSDTHYIIEEIRRLSFEVAALKTNYPQQQRCDCQDRGHPSRSRARSRARTPSQSRSATPSPYCYYHRRFGKDARYCRKPCTYDKEHPNSEN